MNAIQSDKLVMVDCDDTLICWDKSKFPIDEQIKINCYGHDSWLVPHAPNLRTLKKFAKLGYTIVVWSASGWEWAQAVVCALGIEDDVHTVMSKPRYYFDDIPCHEWMGQRVYRDPVTGEPA